MTGLLILLATLAAAPASRPAVVDASADDCAIVVAIGRAEMDWSAHGPNRPFVVEAPAAGGATYRQRCPWRVLGVGAPIEADPARQSERFAIERPTYGPLRATASADLNILGPYRPGEPPFIEIKHCTLRKQRGAWRLIGCEPGIIN